MDKPGKPPLAQPAKGVTGREASNHLPFPTEGFLSESGGERVARGSGLAAGTGSSLQSIVFGLVGHELRIKLVESSSAHPYQPANSDVAATLSAVRPGRPSGSTSAESRTPARRLPCVRFSYTRYPACNARPDF